jgi:Domain of unknown function (DUF4129)
MPTADGSDRPPRPPVLVPAVLAVGLLAVVAAAADTSWSVTDRFRMWGGTPTYRPPRSSASPQPAATPPPLDTSDAPNLLIPLLWALLVLGVLALAFWIWRVLPRAAQKAQRSAELGAHVLGQPVEPAAPAVREGVASAQHLLDTVADPTDAVLAAWVALEGAAERSGVARRPADTPTEFTARVLSATAADEAAVHTLLRLYHRARFAASGVGPSAVAEARACLDVLARSWSVFSAAVQHERDELRP